MLAAAYDRGRESEDQPTSTMIIEIDDAEHASILAALRFWQQHGMGDPDNRSDALHEVATNGNRVISLDGEEIDRLCERLNGVDDEDDEDDEDDQSQTA